MLPIYFVLPVEQTNNGLKASCCINTTYTHNTFLPPAIYNTLFRHVFTTFSLRPPRLSPRKPPNAPPNRHHLLRGHALTNRATTTILGCILPSNACRDKTSQPRLPHLHQRHHPAQPLLDIKFPHQGEPLRRPRTTQAQWTGAPVLLLWTRGAREATRDSGDGV